MRFIKIKTLGVINDHLVDYPTPLVGYSGTFGFLTGVCLVIQIISGTVLAIYYIPNAELAFASVQYIIREVNDG
jgi:ubiquinol-cytochrome c reductase cytochrome b subunit